MKLLPILFLTTGCSLFEPVNRPNEPMRLPPLTVTQKLEKCVHDRIQDGVKPLDALTICDSIYRGRLE